MEIMPLTNEDILFGLEQKNFEDSYSLNGCKEELTSNIKNYIVAKIDDNYVGYAGIMIVDNQAELVRIAVNKEYRKQGIATNLLNFFLEFLKKRNISEIFLEVSEKNSNAIALYKQLGFSNLYTRKNYYHDGSDAIIMVRSV